MTESWVPTDCGEHLAISEGCKEDKSNKWGPFGVVFLASTYPFANHSATIHTSSQND